MNLYEHCFSIINEYHENYTEDKSDKDLSSFNKFMVNKVLSMDYDLIDLSEYMNKYLDIVSDNDYVKSMSSIIPRGRYTLKYKGKKTSTDYNETVDLISKAYGVPYKDAEEYYLQLSDEQIEFILNKFGISNE